MTSKSNTWWASFKYEVQHFIGAACATSGQDPEIWTGDTMDTTLKRRAKKICGDCCVLEKCARYGIAHPELTGIWGGLDDYERSKVRRAVEGRLQ